MLSEAKYKAKYEKGLMNSGNSNTSDPQRLFFNLLDKINVKKSDKYVALWNLRIYYTWKNMKAKIINLSK